MSEDTQMELTTEGFYVQPGCCTSCGVPQSVAPDLVGWTNENHLQCYWIKRPENAAELSQAIKLFQTQELGCHRYSGNDPAVLQKLPAEDYDHFRPDFKLRSVSATRRWWLPAAVRSSSKFPASCGAFSLKSRA
jgi:hypothetical protein